MSSADKEKKGRAAETPQLAVVKLSKADGLGGTSTNVLQPRPPRSYPQHERLFPRLLPEIAAFAVDTRLGAGCVYLRAGTRLGVDYRALEQLLKHYQLKEPLRALQEVLPDRRRSNSKTQAIPDYCCAPLDEEGLRQLRAYVHDHAFRAWKKSNPLSNAKDILRNLSRYEGLPENGNWPLRTRAGDDEWTQVTLPSMMKLLGLDYDRRKRRHVAFGLELTRQVMRSRSDVELHARYFASRVELLEFCAREGLPVPFPHVQEVEGPPPVSESGSKS